MADTFVLDTSAIMSFLEDEPGAEQVQSVLFDADGDVVDLYASFVTLTEIEYITRQERGEDIAQQRIQKLRELPIQWIHSDDVVCAAAAKLKAAHRISFADAFVAATALLFDAVLIHKDPEFDALAPELRQTRLPAKN